MPHCLVEALVEALLGMGGVADSVCSELCLRDRVICTVFCGEIQVWVCGRMYNRMGPGWVDFLRFFK